MKALQKLRSSMAINIIGGIVLMLAIFGAVVSLIGYVSFSTAFRKEYAVSTYHMADAATVLVNGDHLDDYLAGAEEEEYLRTKQLLDEFCCRMNVSLVYVIQVDRSDYGRFVSVFNAVDNAVDDSSYTAWELGHKRDTTNEEYRRKYKALYDGEAAYETVYRIKTTDGQHPHITTLVPLKDSTGDTAGILCVQRPVREVKEAHLPYLRSIAFSTVLLAAIASALAAVYIRRQFVDPILRVSDEAARFARENTKTEPLGEISKLEDLAKLASSIDTMEEDMLRYTETLTAAAAEKERIGTELALAARIQEASIPGEFPAFPERTDFDVYAVMDPAREVGGDFYNFFLIDDDHLALVIGDVSGKGLPASLFMMVTNILITDRMHLGGSPAETLRFVNDALVARNKVEMFVTVWLGILELSTGKLTAANAGHEYPAWKHDGGGFELCKDPHGFVVGGLSDIRYKEYELQFSPGDKLFVYTDGVPEATREDNAMFGTERMLAALNEAPEAAPEQILGEVRRAVDGFVKGAEQFDDLTMLCIEYRGKAAQTEETKGE